MNQATGGSLSRAEQPTASTSAVTVEAAAAAAAAQEAQITSTTGTTARSARNVNLPRPTISTTVLEHGMKGVPDRFELCEMDALIDLLGSSPFFPLYSFFL